MPELSPHIHTLLLWILLGASFLPIIWLLGFYCPRIASVTRAVRRQTERDRNAAGEGEDNTHGTKKAEGVSVIVYSAGEASALSRMLPALLEQEYPGPMEVIVVNDGRNEAVKDAVTLLRHQHRNLHMTFTPEESRNLSRKKLSLTLGIKAARYDNVVLTEERAQFPGKQWLQRMTAPMLTDPSIEIVIGYSAPPYNEDHAGGARYRSFDLAAEGVAYLSAALRGNPWRGTSFNLAYRKDLFFRNKGFGHSLNLQTGDDDIFVSEVTTASNYAVELSPDSQITVATDKPVAYHRNERTQRAFSARKISRRPTMFFGTSSAMMWLWILLAAGTIAAGWPLWWPIVAVAGEACLLWIPVMITWHSVLRALHARPILLTVPWMLLRRPLTGFRYRRHAHRHIQQNYTWSAPV